MFEAVLFDLDGTLADTAPDLGAAANAVLVEAGRAPKPLAELRPYTSSGVRGLLKASFGITPEHPDYPSLSARFLEHYLSALCVHTQLFDGIPELLDHLEKRGILWGIVTNKRSRFTDPLVAQLGLAPRTPCVVSGDTTPEAKPSPRPILYACELLGCAPSRTLYVGDDLRDIQAGLAAGCVTAAVSYGYLGHNGPIDSWSAHFVAAHPKQLIEFICTKRGQSVSDGNHQTNHLNQ